MKEVTKVISRADTVESFFDRARKAAQKADRGEPFRKSVTFSFEDQKKLLGRFQRPAGIH